MNRVVVTGVRTNVSPWAAPSLLPTTNCVFTPCCFFFFYSNKESNKKRSGEWWEYKLHLNKKYLHFNQVLVSIFSLSLLTPRTKPDKTRVLSGPIYDLVLGLAVWILVLVDPYFYSWFSLPLVLGSTLAVVLCILFISLTLIQSCVQSWV